MSAIRSTAPGESAGGSPAAVAAAASVSSSASATRLLPSGAPAPALLVPPNAASILLQCLETQRQLRGAAVAREADYREERSVKHCRAAMLRAQQRRRDEQSRIDRAALAETSAMLEDLVMGVRNRELALQPDGYQAFVFHNDDLYEGCWKNGRMHGKGCLRRARTRDLYEGQWFLGQRCGPGTFRAAACASVYSGTWLDDERHGRGELVEPEGVYAGEFVNNALSGFGEYVYLDGHVYRGEWRDGLYHGHGTYLYPSGSRYEGDWRDGREHGSGTRIFPNGDVYSGEWRDGRPHGYGVYTCSGYVAAAPLSSPAPAGGWGAARADASSDTFRFRYEGRWAHGALQGDGTCRVADGSRYTGQWAHSRPCGTGVIIFPPSSSSSSSSAASAAAAAAATTATSASGIEYFGAFEGGRPHGYGEYRSDFVVYKGPWRHGRKDGDGGALTAQGGGTYVGRWRHDVPDGDGTYHAAVSFSAEEAAANTAADSAAEGARRRPADVDVALRVRCADGVCLSASPLAPSEESGVVSNTELNLRLPS